MEMHTAYLQNLLRFLGYVSILQEPILKLVIENILQMDLEIQVELEELEEANAQESARFDSEGNQSDPESESDVESVILVNISEMAMKLDSLMSMVMDYIASAQRLFRDSPDELSEFLHPFLNIFESSLLSTHRSRYTQFIWFYICSLDHSFADLFLGILVGKSIDERTSTPVRISAVSYLASYIARAKYLDLNCVNTCLGILTTSALKYIDENNSATIELKAHIVFYTTVQALLYIFCFRWKELLCDADSNIKHGSFPTTMEGFGRVIASKLNPLKVTSLEFFKIRLISLVLLIHHCRRVCKADAST